MTQREHSTISRRRMIGTTLSTTLGATLGATGTALAAGILPAGMATAMARTDPAGPEVRTGHGPVRGRLDNGVNVFKGIPYGAPTTGINRFKPARTPSPWKEPMDAFAYGHAAAQLPSPLLQEQTISEDCLNLNVWSPGVNDKGKRPVMVWLHGGGFSSLSGSSPLYDGGALCRRGDVVVVTLNHRLNVFGFLHVADLHQNAAKEFATAGNEGMLDIVLALEWVKKNIRRFGGDAGNVTIFGESGGGRKVSTLMGMPSARGLFHRAIIQSGPGLHLQPRDKASEVARAFLDELKIKPENVAALQKLPTGPLLEAYGNVSADFDASARSKGRFEQRGFVPTVGVDELPEYSFDPVASPLSKDVPLLIGSNRHEMALFTQSDPKIHNRTLTEEELAERVAVMAGTASERVLGTYASQFPNATPAEQWIMMVSDRTYRLDSITIAQRKAMQGPAAYMYFFTWESRTNPKLLAHHALEIPFVFDNLDKSPWTDTGPESRQLAARMSQAWIAFARDGDPNTVTLPNWPQYNTTQRATMVFDKVCSVHQDPNSSIRQLWSTV